MRLRRVLAVLGIVVALLCTVCAGAGVWIWNSQTVDTTDAVDFTRPLAVPPLAPSRLEGGRRVFDLRAQAGTHDFGRGTTPTWGFNGDVLGPTLRATRGEQVVVNVTNGLDQTTTVHWHGMHLPPEMDGGPHQLVAPGRTWSPAWKIEQPAASLWYHPHLHGETAKHVYQGLAGMFIVDDPATSVAALPHEYGVDDIPVIVQDRKFDAKGKLDDAPGIFSGVGVLGDTIAVNGTVGPYLEVKTQRVRLRLLNGSNARVYDFGFADGRQFDLVGTDGGLLEAAHRTDRLMLSPGERAEIVVTVKAGSGRCCAATRRTWARACSGGSPAGRTRSTCCNCGPRGRFPRARRCRSGWSPHRGSTALTPRSSGSSSSAGTASTAGRWT
ncbi:multicopper oxidase family protein [Catellatospora bangladeshensis]|uniref:multicopper oxidase family protein n=1 Tax=Catellatospora bangladeshensis TaxID=310355 RepID=UPI0036156EC7